MEGPSIRIIDSFVDDPEELLIKLRDEIEWDERMRARKTASFGVAYNYSGITYPKRSMLPNLENVCGQIDREIGFHPNNCLLNYYIDGASTMGYHSDLTEDLSQGTGVVIISLGAERTISYRRITDKNEKYKYNLSSGALLFMDDVVQYEWQHAIPKQAGAGERISLTFRNIIE